MSVASSPDRTEELLITIFPQTYIVCVSKDKLEDLKITTISKEKP